MIVNNILYRAGWEKHPRLLLRIIQSQSVSDPLLEQLLKEPQWRDSAELKAFCGGREVTLTNIKNSLAAAVNIPGALKECVKMVLNHNLIVPPR
jgi:hypothetical protein